MEKEHPFPPLYDAQSRILILGTLPSIESTKQGFYYMHPQNRFWKLLSRIYKEDVYHMNIEEKKAFLLKHHLALYDVIQSCEITNSSDASIKNPIGTNIAALLKKMPQLYRIILNGKTAYRFFIKKYPNLKEYSICLPSTSSANASVSLDELEKIWSKPLCEEEKNI